MSGTFDCIKNGEPSDKEEENKMFNTCGTSEKPIVMAKFVADGAEDVCMRYMSVVIDGVRYATGRAASGSVETDYGLLRKDLCRILGDKRERVVFPRDRLIAVIKTPPRELPKSACFVGTRAEADAHAEMLRRRKADAHAEMSFPRRYLEYIASRINGMEYGQDIPSDIVEEAKRSGIAIVFGGSDDLVNRTVHYRLSEMFDMGWIEYRDSVMSSKAIFATPRGQYIHEIVTDVLADIECLGGA